MRLKEKYQINDATWAKLKNIYRIGILFGSPFFSIIFTLITWAIFNDLSWTPLILFVLFPWLIFYLVCLIFISRFFVRSKYTAFTMLYVICLIGMYFAASSSACIFRFFGINALIIQNLILIIASIFFCRYYYCYWNKVWESHKRHNETVAIDLENGRHDFLNNFDMNEDEVKKSKTKKLSNPAMINLAISIAPVGVAISFIFSKNNDHKTPLIIFWVLSIPLILGWLKMVMAGFYYFKKLSYYEKKIGKPIINGLLK